MSALDDPATLAACASGAYGLASACGVPADALEAARSLASWAASCGRLDRAQVLLEGCVALDPSDAWSWRALASLALRRGDAAGAHRAAAQAAQIARARGERDAEAALLLARALVALGHAADARPWLDVAIAAGDGALRRAAGALRHRLSGSR